MIDKELLALLRCPACQAPLSPEGAGLACASQHAYPLRDGLPCFVDSSGDAFESHWSEEAAPRIPQVKRVVAREFLAPLRSLCDEGPPLLLDAGCGDGVHASLLAEASWVPEGTRYVGLDTSLSALRAASARGRAAWHEVQASVDRLPFADHSFDGVFSFGVLGYTPSPAASFGELCRVTRPGGLLGLWVAPPPTGVLGNAFRLTRRASQALGPRLTRRLADAVVPWLSVLPTRSGVSLRNASWRQCREVVLVNIAPRQLTFPTAQEVDDWASQSQLGACRGGGPETTRWWRR